MAQNKMKQTSRRNVEIQVLSKFKSLLIYSILSIVQYIIVQYVFVIATVFCSSSLSALYAICWISKISLLT